MTHLWWFPVTIVLIDVLLNISKVRFSQINVQESSIHLIPEPFVFCEKDIHSKKICTKKKKDFLFKMEEEQAAIMNKGSNINISQMVILFKPSFEVITIQKESS